MNDMRGESEDGGFMSEAVIKMSAANLREDDPDIKRTLDRLTAEGRSLEDAKELVARALAVETHAMFREGKSFDTERLLMNLEALPEQPRRWRVESGSRD